MSVRLDNRRLVGVDVLVREGDIARTVLVLHGIGGRAASFSQLFAVWPTGPRLVVWDAPGYGNSEPLDRSVPTPLDYARRLDAVRAALDVATPVIIGQSLGGLIALAYAAHIGNLSRLVLLAPALGYATPSDKPMPAALGDRVEAFTREGAAAFAKRRAPRLVHDAASHPLTVADVERSMASLNDAGHRQAVHALSAGDARADAALVRVPTLVLSGASDVVTPPAGSRELYDILRARTGPVLTRYVDIADAGHAAYLEQPTAVLAALTSFLEAP